MMRIKCESLENDVLPKGWQWTTIEDITQKVEKVTPQEEPNNEFVYIDISSIDNTRNIIVNPKSYQGSSAPSRARQKIFTNDVLLSTVRTYLKNTAIVPEIYDQQIASTGFAVLRSTEVIVAKYLYYFCLSDNFVNALSSFQRGVSYPAVSEIDVKKQLLALAPLAEQHRIVAKIEELFTQLDAAEAALKRAKANLERYRRSVLQAAVTGELTKEWRAAHPDNEPASALVESSGHTNAISLSKFDVSTLPDLPKKWIYTRIDPLLSTEKQGLKTGPFGSLLKKHEHKETGVPVLGIENIRKMRFVFGSKIHITKEKAGQLSEYSVAPGDLLVSRSGTVGEICVIPDGIGEARISTNIIRISLNHTVVPQFFSYLFNGSQFVIDQIHSLCSGSTRDFLNQTIIKTLIFPLPAQEEQIEIVSQIETTSSLIEQIGENLNSSLKRIARLRQSILEEAFHGRLVAQNPEDEPAAALLQRIQAERAANAALPKTQKPKGKK